MTFKVTLSVPHYLLLSVAPPLQCWQAAAAQVPPLSLDYAGHCPTLIIGVLQCYLLHFLTINADFRHENVIVDIVLYKD